MKRSLIGAIAVLALSTTAALAQVSDRRQITVNGEGAVEVAPDMATITLGVTNEAQEAKAAMDATSDAVAQVLARLTEKGIDGGDIETTLSRLVMTRNDDLGVQAPSHLSRPLRTKRIVTARGDDQNIDGSNRLSLFWVI